MKRIALCIVFLCFFRVLCAQEIELSGGYGYGSWKQFSHNFGGTLGYDLFLKPRHRIGVSFSFGVSTVPYNDTYISLATGRAVNRAKVTPYNSHAALRVSYTWSMVNKPRFKLNFGPEIGLNSFWIRETADGAANGNTPGGKVTFEGSKMNRWGSGLLIEAELKQVIQKNTALFFSILPEITGYEISGQKGSNSPATIGWLNLNVGIRYSLSHPKKR
ncbi:MAG: hypothetical protein WCK34_05415 [Bacteroidota bacterium]